MGLGGNLIWTGALKAIYDADGRPPVVCASPKLTDLLAGILWDRGVSLENDPVFQLNPHLAFTTAQPKSIVSKAMDLLFSYLVRPRFIRRGFERQIHRMAQKRFLKGGPRLVHVDMLIHSYAQAQTARRMIWKQGGHASQIVAQGFGIKLAVPNCELAFSSLEEKWIKQFLEATGLGGPFIVIEPGSNQDWFGALRAWPMNKWSAVIHKFIAEHSSVPVVQIGLQETPLLEGALDLRGKTSFRQAALIIRQSALFMGTEGGLMHAARAVGSNALILWGGVTLPEFAGYPQSQRVICHYVDCAPCGNLGWCDKGHVCMASIEVDEVMEEIKNILSIGSI